MSHQPPQVQPAPPPRPGGPSQTASRPGLWRQATSTTGGLVATVVALVLTGLLLLGVVGAGILGVTRYLHRAADGGVASVREHRQWSGDWDGMGPGERGDGMMRGYGLLQRLGGLEHGEFTVTGADGTALVLTVQRGAVTSASATSVAVKSDDGFAQTYALTSTTRVARGSAADLKAGAEVVVLARKQGRVAVQVWPDLGR
jgi:hypothetical protein